MTKKTNKRRERRILNKEGETRKTKRVQSKEKKGERGG